MGAVRACAAGAANAVAGSVERGSISAIMFEIIECTQAFLYKSEDSHKMSHVSSGDLNANFV